MWGTPYASFGGHSMNMETGLAHVIPARRYFGLNTIHIDMMEIWGRIKGGKYDKEAGDVVAWLTQDDARPHHTRIARTGRRPSSRRASTTSAKMYLAMKEIMGELGATVGGFQGQRQWNDYLPTGDVPEAILNDTFDHTGRKLPIAFATENDFNRGVSQRISVGLPGGLPAIFMDFRKAYIAGDPLLRKNAAEQGQEGHRRSSAASSDFCNSGNHPPFYGGAVAGRPGGELQERKPLAGHQVLLPGRRLLGRVQRRRRATCSSRASALRPDGAFVMQAAMGKSVPLSDKLAKAINTASDPTWPHLYGVFDDP